MTQTITKAQTWIVLIFLFYPSIKKMMPKLLIDVFI